MCADEDPRLPQEKDSFMELREIRIDAYSPQMAALAHDSQRPAAVWAHECAEIGGFNPHTRQLTKICCSDEIFMSEHLDHVTAAVEAGMVRKHAFMEQLFASRQDFEEFLEYLLAYPGRIHDRWHYALATLAGCSAASDALANNSQLIDALRDAAGH